MYGNPEDRPDFLPLGDCPTTVLPGSPEIPHKLPCGAKWVWNGESVTNAGWLDGCLMEEQEKFSCHLDAASTGEQSAEWANPAKLLLGQNLSRCQTAGRRTAMQLLLSPPCWHLKTFKSVQLCNGQHLLFFVLVGSWRLTGWGPGPTTKRGGGEVKDVSEGPPGGGLWDCHQGPVL